MKYSFKSNRSVKRASANELTLPLDGTAFSEALDQLAGYIESVWKKPTLSLKVKWIQPQAVEGAFRFILEQGAGGRSYVLFSEFAVHLFPYVRSLSIAHEIGHVLGFKDHYYSVWSREKCGYINQSLETDLMSDSSVGSVSDQEWNDLEDAYPVK